MIKRAVLATITVAGLTLAGVAVAPVASASKGCVTQQEFAKAKPGMSMARVAKLFGTKGTVVSETSGFGTTIVIRDYKPCTQFAAVNVLYENGKLQSKSGIF